MTRTWFIYTDDGVVHDLKFKHGAAASEAAIASAVAARISASPRLSKSIKWRFRTDLGHDVESFSVALVPKYRHVAPSSPWRLARRESSSIGIVVMATGWEMHTADALITMLRGTGRAHRPSGYAMIEYKTGDIFAEDAEALVNTVNCVGVMGRGIALQFKRAFPENFKAYAARCKRNEIQPGKVFIFETGEMISPRFIVNFPTKRHWRGKSRLEDIESGLGSLADEIRSRGIRSIAIPALGSGLGGLNWSDVRSRMQEALSELDDVRIVIFEPGGGPADRRGNAGSLRPQSRRI